MSEVIEQDGLFSELDHRPGILLLLSGVFCLVGGLLYMFKVPERFSPGQFDLWFHSHQLFHVLVVTGGLLYYHSITQIMHLRLRDPDYYFN